MINRTVALEAANAQQALENVLALANPQSITMTPKTENKDSHWYSKSTVDPKDELVIKDTETARKIVAKVRKDVVEVFSFVSPEELQHSKNKTRKVK